MSKFMNVVRSKVKEGKKDELMKKFKEFFDVLILLAFLNFTSNNVHKFRHFSFLSFILVG